MSDYQPPPGHQTLVGHTVVICACMPRIFDDHPQGIPAPYNHSRVDSAAVICCCDGSFASRRGIGVSNLSMHPHGPRPGSTEDSHGARATSELAVMVNTWRPLSVSRAAMALDKPGYPGSWGLGGPEG